MSELYMLLDESNDEVTFPTNIIVEGKLSDIKRYLGGPYKNCKTKNDINEMLCAEKDKLAMCIVL